MDLILYIATGVIAAALAVAVTLLMQRSMARSRAMVIIADAEREADDLKKSKILEGREEALKITAEAEKTANQRISRVQSLDAKAKQRELALNQQQSENQRNRNEIEQQRTKLEER